MPRARPAVYATARLPAETLGRVRAACETGVREASGPLTREELIASLEGAAGLLCVNNAPLDAAFFASLPASVRVISQVGVGYDNVDLPAATEASVLVCNTPNVLTRAVADLTLGVIVYVARNLGPFSAFAKASWGRAPAPALGVDVHAKTLGIMGLGACLFIDDRG
jgi:glyoxylate reductase